MSLDDDDIALTVALAGTTAAFSGDATVADEAYGSGWNGSLEVPTKNAVYDAIQSGTYTPTYSAVLNSESITGQDLHFRKIGSEVEVSGFFTAAATAIGVADVGITLPFPSNLATAVNLSGHGSSTNETNASTVTIRADTTNDIALLRFLSASAGGTAAMYFSFTYTIL